MADSGGLEMFEREEFDITQIIRLQSAVRGVLVRKWMKEVKQTFEETFLELEKNAELSVDWKTEFPCKPKAVRTRDKLKKEKRNRQTNVSTEKVKQLQNSEVNLQNDILDNETDFKETPSTGIKHLGTLEHVSSEGEGETLSEISEAVKESPKFNSVEIQTSFIDNNHHYLPQKTIEHDCDKEKDQGNNILDDLDTSWKDRVEPFIRNNFGEVNTEEGFAAKDNEVRNELHLNLETDRESVQSQRSSKRSYRDSAREESSENDKQDSIRNEVFRDKSKFEERITRTSDRSEKSQASLGQRFDRKDESVYRDQGSSRSVDRSSRSGRNETKDLSARSPSASDRNSHRSGRSKRSSDRGHNLNETEGFSPRGQRSNSPRYSDQRSQKSYRSENRSGHLSNRLDVSDKERQNTHRSQDAKSHRSDGGKSYRSEEVKSHRSDGSKSQRSEDAKSYRSDSVKSQRSNSSEGRLSQKSERSQRSSRKDEGQRSDRRTSEEKMLPLESRASPVPSKLSGREQLQGDNSREGRPPLHDSTTLTNVTSVWDSFNSIRESHDVEMSKSLPQDAGQLKELRKNIAMELLWVQQAIDSRKNYLKLKGQM
ncbi:pre-mRNA-splicing factor CWC22 homolog [Ruditapes philippinarum]|uniref:pre-mRNA-splicing factor CWC22 homolog n=1 Tax=Ruditapes philippinarum TaxID=129788 RepID=UPI00295C0270|nr:pre-mRNA-splicing factor CWC22 homolog [Ruditapes philippinarum]